MGTLSILLLVAYLLIGLVVFIMSVRVLGYLTILMVMAAPLFIPLWPIVGLAMIGSITIWEKKE